MLSQLRDTRKRKVHAINLYNQTDIKSDERCFAKKIADHCSVPLTYLETSACLPFSIEKFFFKPSLPSVTFKYLASDIAIHQQISAIAESYLLVSGHGGDSIFLAVPPIESVIDPILRKQYRLAFDKLKGIPDYFPMPYRKHAASLVKILFQYLQKKQPNLFAQIADCAWLNVPLDLPRAYEHHHPIFEANQSKRSLPGKAVQIESYYVTLTSAERQLPTIYPLLKTATAESALAIPSYNSFDKKYSRIVFRKLFERLAGPAFSYRQSKGQSTGAFFQGVKKTTRTF